MLPTSRMLLFTLTLMLLMPFRTSSSRAKCSMANKDGRTCESLLVLTGLHCRTYFLGTATDGSATDARGSFRVPGHDPPVTVTELQPITVYLPRLRR